MTTLTHDDLVDSDNAFILGRLQLETALIKALKDRPLADIYSQVRTHLLTQKAKSTSPENTCVYRSPLGYKCAVGCLIPDEDYSPIMEGIGVVSKADGHGFWGLLKVLQHVHDVYDTFEWEAKLGQVAKQFGFEVATEVVNEVIDTAANTEDAQNDT